MGAPAYSVYDTSACSAWPVFFIYYTSTFIRYCFVYYTVYPNLFVSIFNFYS